MMATTVPSPDALGKARRLIGVSWTTRPDDISMERMSTMVMLSFGGLWKRPTTTRLRVLLQAITHQKSYWAVGSEVIGREVSGVTHESCELLGPSSRQRWRLSPSHQIDSAPGASAPAEMPPGAWICCPLMMMRDPSGDCMYGGGLCMGTPRHPHCPPLTSSDPCLFPAQSISSRGRTVPVATADCPVYT